MKQIVELYQFVCFCLSNNPRYKRKKTRQDKTEYVGSFVRDRKVKDAQRHSCGHIELSASLLKVSSRSGMSISTLADNQPNSNISLNLSL